MIGDSKLSQSLILSLHHLRAFKNSAFDFLFSLPTSLLSFILLLLLAYNGFHVFCILPPSPAITIPATPDFSHGIVNTTVLQNPHFPFQRVSNSVSQTVRKRKRRLRGLRREAEEDEFSERVEEFFAANSCKFRFFMTWISPLKSFGDRELLSIQSLFKSHANGCLVIVSNSLDSTEGRRILNQFSENGFWVIPISPDFDSIFRNTEAEKWFNQLREGIIEPGEISLGQNLSNLLRLALLYKFGGIYIDTDIIILKSFSNLRNSIGAQAIDLETGNWSRLNNAVLIFDKNHPLLLEFIKEFSTTFDGNKWGHNGPYLVSRVVSRLNHQQYQQPVAAAAAVEVEGLLNFTILPPSAFYPVVWIKIKSHFQGPKDKVHSKWILAKVKQIRSNSFGLHLWNRHSRKLQIEKGSVVDLIKWSCCLFCNPSAV